MIFKVVIIKFKKFIIYGDLWLNDNVKLFHIIDA